MKRRSFIAAIALAPITALAGYKFKLAVPGVKPTPVGQSEAYTPSQTMDSLITMSTDRGTLPWSQLKVGDKLHAINLALPGEPGRTFTTASLSSIETQTQFSELFGIGNALALDASDLDCLDAFGEGNSFSGGTGSGNATSTTSFTGSNSSCSGGGQANHTVITKVEGDVISMCYAIRCVDGGGYWESTTATLNMTEGQPATITMREASSTQESSTFTVTAEDLAANGPNKPCTVSVDGLNLVCK